MSLINKIISRFNISTTQQKVVKNLVWAVVGKIVTLLGSLLVGIFVARYLGPQQYGLMNYVFSYIAVFQVFATFGLDSIEIREEARRKEQTHRYCLSSENTICHYYHTIGCGQCMDI